MKQVFKECKVNNGVCRRVPLVIPTSCMQMANFLQSKILDARLHGLFGCKNDGSGQKKKNPRLPSTEEKLCSWHLQIRLDMGLNTIANSPKC